MTDLEKLVRFAGFAALTAPAAPAWIVLAPWALAWGVVAAAAERKTTVMGD